MKARWLIAIFGAALIGAALSYAYTHAGNRGDRTVPEKFSGRGGLSFALQAISRCAYHKLRTEFPLRANRVGQDEDGG
jgi:hypothetical protein